MTTKSLLETAAKYRALAEQAKSVNPHDRRFYLRSAETHERLAAEPEETK